MAFAAISVASVRAALLAPALGLADAGALNALVLVPGTLAAHRAASVAATGETFASGLASTLAFHAFILGPLTLTTGPFAAVIAAHQSFASGLADTLAFHAFVLRPFAFTASAATSVVTALRLATIGNTIGDAHPVFAYGQISLALATISTAAVIAALQAVARWFAILDTTALEADWHFLRAGPASAATSVFAALLARAGRLA